MNAQQRFDLSGRVAVVTGGSRGIGRGLAVGLAQHGADVAIVYRSAKPEADSAADEIRALGRRVWTYQYDLAEHDGLADLAARMWRECGRIDILVNNAGIAYQEHYDEISAEHWRKIMAVNLDAVFYLTQAVAPKMVAEGVKGRIINLSSKNGFVAEAGLAHYNASKGGLELLTQSLAIELGAHGITVNTLSPGVIETEIIADFETPPEFIEYYREHIPLEHRFGSVEDCVGACVFLASDASAYMTGQTIIVDGGVLCQQLPRLQFMKRK